MIHARIRPFAVAGRTTLQRPSHNELGRQQMIKVTTAIPANKPFWSLDNSVSGRCKRIRHITSSWRTTDAVRAETA
jgi:hypothetical protein